MKKHQWDRWRALLEQKTPHDYRYIIKKTPQSITIDIIDNETNARPAGKSSESGEESGLAHMVLKKRGEEGNWEVASAVAPENSRGVGKELYLLALELAAGSGISPDSVSTSPAARGLWINYLKNHPLVSYEEKKSEIDADSDDPFKYIWRISPDFESNLDIEYQKTPQSFEIDPVEQEVDPFDPENTDFDDYLDGIDENQLPQDTKKVSKVVIYDKNGRILLLKRADKGHNWDLPGGHLQKGEDHETGASRETKEETNLTISALKHVNDHKNTKFYKCKAPKGQIKLQPEEHIDFKWVNPKKIDDFSMRKSLKDAILTAIRLVSEDFQQNVKKNYSKMKFKLTGTGPNQYNIDGKMKKPSYKRSKSAPAGFGGT